MGSTVWVLSEDRDEDEWDHSLILVHEKSLDMLADQLCVKRLSDFYDYSILAEDFDGQVEPNYISADELELVLYSLIKAIHDGNAGKLNENTEIIEELEDCAEKVSNAKHNGSKIRFAIVP